MLAPPTMFERARVSATTGATQFVVAPPGDLGLTFMDGANKGVMIASIDEKSPLASEVVKGWLLLEIDGVRLLAGDIEGARTRLHNRREKKRRLKLLDHEAEASLLQHVYEAWSAMSYVVVEAPAGKLGVSFATADGRTTVAGLTTTSPLRGRVGLAWRILAVDETDVSKCSHSEVAALLTVRGDKERRVLQFDAEKHIRAPRILGIVLVAMLAFCVAVVLRGAVGGG